MGPGDVEQWEAGAGAGEESPEGKPVLLLHSPRRNRRISLAFREVLLPGSRPDIRTAGTVCVSVLLFSSHTAFSAQYDSVLAICCHLLIGSAWIVWTSEVGVSGGVLLPVCIQPKERWKKAESEKADISHWESVTWPYFYVSVQTGLKFGLLVESIVILSNATLYCHKALITCPHFLWNAYYIFSFVMKLILTSLKWLVFIYSYCGSCTVISWNIIIMIYVWESVKFKMILLALEEEKLPFTKTVILLAQKQHTKIVWLFHPQSIRS